MLAATSPVLAILNEEVGKLNLSPEEQYLYESRMKLKSDIVSIQESSFKRGIEKGIEKGRTEGIISTARNLLNMGFPIESIAKATGLSTAKIEKLI